MKKKFRLVVIIILILVVIGIVCLKVVNIPQKIYQRIYKVEYSEYVYKYAEEYNVDPLMIFAIIKAESNFNPNVVSSSGAVGLMQLMDGTTELRHICLDFGNSSATLTLKREKEILIQEIYKMFRETIKENDLGLLKSFVNTYTKNEEDFDISWDYNNSLCCFYETLKIGRAHV